MAKNDPKAVIEFERAKEGFVKFRDAQAKYYGQTLETHTRIFDDALATLLTVLMEAYPQPELGVMPPVARAPLQEIKSGMNFVQGLEP